MTGDPGDLAPLHPLSSALASLGKLQAVVCVGKHHRHEARGGQARSLAWSLAEIKAVEGWFYRQAGPAPEPLKATDAFRGTGSDTDMEGPTGHY